MLNKSNYQSPYCTTMDVCAEGVLCSSTGEVNARNTETFNQITDFEW